MTVSRRRSSHLSLNHLKSEIKFSLIFYELDCSSLIFVSWKNENIFEFRTVLIKKKNVLKRFGNAAQVWVLNRRQDGSHARSGVTLISLNNTEMPSVNLTSYFIIKGKFLFSNTQLNVPYFWKKLLISWLSKVASWHMHGVDHATLENSCLVLTFNDGFLFPSKGISQSALPYRRSVPTWLKLSSDDVQEQIFKLAKKGLTPSQIGEHNFSSFILW